MKKFIGVVYREKVVPFPSPGAPAYGYGKKYCIVLDGNKLGYLDANGTERASSITKREAEKYLKKGDWGVFDQDPFLPSRGNVPATTPYGGCP